MQPPQWALRNSRRVDLDEFSSEFGTAWSQIEFRFLKLEAWQSYQEIEASKSQEAYNRGDAQRAEELLREEAEGDRPLYEDIAKRKIDYARVRLIQEPLTSYLHYELMAYRIRAAMGENIEIVRRPADERLPNERYFDFLLFDRHTALIHDYGDAGLQSGGWVSHDAEVINLLEQTANELRVSSLPLRNFAS